MVGDQVEDIPVVCAQVFFLSVTRLPTSLVSCRPKGFVLFKPSRWVLGNKLVRQMADDTETGRVKIVGELASKPVLLPRCVSAGESAIESPST